MASLLDSITQQLGGDTLGQIGRMLGTDEKQAGTATGAAVTTLLGALARNASKPGGAEALHGALNKDHDGSVLNNLSGFLQNPEAGNGEGILRHVLGSQRGSVEKGLGQATGMDSGAMGKLLATLAPVVMGALGQNQRKNNLNASALTNMLGQEQQEISKREPQAMGMLGKLLDTDGDGDLDLSDLAKHGKGLLGKFFNR